MSELDEKKVIVGLSGGVDSSTTAALLLKEGYEVIGITIKMWGEDCINRTEDKCCGPQAVMDARAICSKLGIPHYIVDLSKEFKQEVIEYFANEYKSGRTPNPCVVCNRKIKFYALIKMADQLGAKWVSTGHYAKIEYSPELQRWLLKRGKDTKKDQSYFLFSLTQEQLERTLLPLGDLTKEDTRKYAEEFGLKTAKKVESQEICFVPDGNYAEFLKKSALVSEKKGVIVNQQGRVLGYHNGIHMFTIGQRKGIKIPAEKPYYVVDLDPSANRVIIGSKEDLISNELIAKNCNWIKFGTPPEKMDVIAKIRYNHAGAPATIYPGENGSVLVRFHTPQRAITPGQACVFYDGDTVVGGGWIAKKDEK